MEWHVNDLSIDRQFPTAEALRQALEPLLVARQKYSQIRERLYCSRILFMRPGSENASLQGLVVSHPQRTFRSQVLSWLANSGPFWDDDRELHADDYFEWETYDVTNQGLGEAARRRLRGRDARSFSFQGSPNNFATSPLAVDHGLQEDRLGRIEIQNYWTLGDLAKVIEESRPAAQRWTDVTQSFAERFPNLIFTQEIADQLRPHPFSLGIAERIYDLLSVLDGLVKESSAEGALTAQGVELLNKHFVGDKAWFTDESDANKFKFKNDLTFSDPGNPARNLFCSWHGKIKIQQFRIHFEWPRAASQRAIKVVYVGPKITKG